MRDCTDRCKDCLGENKDCLGERKDCLGERKDCLDERKDCIEERKDCIDAFIVIGIEENEMASGSLIVVASTSIFSSGTAELVRLDLLKRSCFSSDSSPSILKD